MATDRDFTQLTARIEALLAELGASENPRVSDASRELVQCLMDFYGAGLARALDIVREDAAGAPLVARLARDPLVASLLVLHDLHPDDLRTRLGVALDTIANAHRGVAAHVVHMGDEIVRVRVQRQPGSLDPPDAVLRSLVEQAVRQAVPEVLRVEIEGLIASPLIQIQV